MKLIQVDLHNFRSFEDATFDLKKPGSPEPLDVVLLVGGNGSGKTSFLKAVTGFFAAVTETAGIPSYGAEALSGNDVRRNKPEATIGVEWLDEVGEPLTPITVQWQVGLRMNAPPATISTMMTSASPAQRAAFESWKTALHAPRHPAGLIVAFYVYRFLPPRKPVEGPNIAGLPKHRCEMALAPSMSPDGMVRVRSQQLKQWIVNLDLLRAKAKADRREDLPLWNTLRHALNTLLSPYTFEGVDENFQVIFRTAYGTVPLETLSDGFLSIFVIISELLFRLSLATTRQEDVLQQEGVCMIDEIDAHLHPRWQANVIPGLRAMFPKVQFIATTHSPIVVSSVEPENVFRLEQKEP